MDETPPPSKLEDLITAYRKRFKDDPPLMGVDKDDLARRIQEALTTGQAIRTEDFGVPPDAYVSPSSFTWQEGRVDHQQTHLEIYYVLDLQHEGPSFLIAAIAPPKNQVFLVELLPENLPVEMDREPVITGVKRELNFYLQELPEPDPWKYARYHCTTTSNFQSHFQWAVSDR